MRMNLILDRVRTLLTNWERRMENGEDHVLARKDFLTCGLVLPPILLQGNHVYSPHTYPFGLVVFSD